MTPLQSAEVDLPQRRRTESIFSFMCFLPAITLLLLSAVKDAALREALQITLMLIRDAQHYKGNWQAGFLGFF